MATNKHATIRYHTLDQCFSNPGRNYFMDDLIEACNNALNDFTGSEIGIKRRQIFDDITFMESEQGWSIPLERFKEGKRVYYRYSDSSFSIRNQAINETEANQLRETLSIFTRFKGMPQFEWMEEIMVRIESSFNLKGENSSFVSFEQNPYLKGLNHFSELFNAIQYKRVLSIIYQSFKHTFPLTFTIHPYYLKQYNNRWFLFGLNEEYNCVYNLPLDRITSFAPVDKSYIENAFVDFEEYFDDIVGVTVNVDQEPIKILLQVNKNRWPYIETKPLHGSQKVKSRDEEYTTIELSLQLNNELISLLFSYGEDIKVLAPEELINILKNKAEALLRNYL
jgi:predicted DNA-binding transcriptional regulator YafY